MSSTSWTSIVEPVIGRDDRVWVSDTTTYPYSAVCKIFSYWSDGSTTVGSGAMVGRNDVLTAAHNLYSPSHGGFAQEISVIPGMAGDDEPYGSYAGVRWSVPDDYTGSSDFEDDVGIVNIGSNIGDQTGWFGMSFNDSVNAYETSRLYNAGYPGDLYSGDYMYWSTGNVYSVSGNLVYYTDTIDTYGGHSGGPTWIELNGQPYIVIVHTFGVTATGRGGGTNLDDSEFRNLIRSWINEGDGSYTTGTTGADALSGTTGDDTIFASDGDDTVEGADGADMVYGNKGIDSVYGGGGADSVFGGQGDDLVRGDDGNDRVYGNRGADVVSGGAGADSVYGGQEDDTVYGGDGGDHVLGNKGDDLLYGDGPATSTGAGTDTIDGGDGTDTAVYLSDRSAYNLVRLADGGIQIGGFDIAYNVEYLRFADQTVATSTI